MRSSKTALSIRQEIFFALSVSLLLCLSLWPVISQAQSGRAVVNSRRTLDIPVIAQRVDDPNKPKRLLASVEDKAEVEKIVSKLELELFDGGVLQKIEAFAPDPTPARIVILLDNSATVQTDVKKLAAVPAAFAPEIYEGDK